MENLTQPSGEPGKIPVEEVPDNAGFLELGYGVLFHPAQTFGKMKDRPPLFYSLLVVLGVTLLSSLVNYLAGTPAQIGELPQEAARDLKPLLEIMQTPGFGLASALFGAILSLFFWVFNGGFLQLTAEFLGGKGKGLEVLTVTGFSNLPMVFQIPVQALLYITGLPSEAGLLASFPLMIWSYLVLPVIGLSEVHRIGTGRAIAAVLTPVIVLVGLIFAVILVITLSLIPFIAQFQG